MRTLFNTLIGIGFLVIIATTTDFGWSPLNLLFGPQYQAQAQPKTKGDSRASFIAETVPKQYPKLVELLRDSGPETVRWTTDSGEAQEELLSLNGKTLQIEASIFTVASPARAETSSEKILVRMSDTNLDGSMDTITYVNATGQTHSYKAPFDETSRFLWDSALAIAFRFGKCCG